MTAVLTESHYRYMVNEAQECLDWLKRRPSVDACGVDNLEKIVERAKLRLEKSASVPESNAALSDLFAAHEVLRTLRIRPDEPKERELDQSHFE